ncbi:MAG: zinc-binding dehydrogenase, partial [Candidatus Lokiarchaeota archaeon]|nr:zinc-binding dehydrogenase [Candidatus Lokiarchaeota archaeon]
IRKHPINQLFVVEPMEFRRKKALELGANYVFNPETDDIEKKIKDLTNNHGADVVIDAVGKSSTFEIAQKIWASRGRLILFGQDSRAVGTIKPNNIVRWQRSILGSYISSGVDYLDAISLISNNTIDTDKLISHKIPLENLLSEGMKIMKEKKGLKIIVIP